MVRIYALGLASVCLAICSTTNADHSDFEQGTFEILGSSTLPAVISEGQAFQLVLSGFNLYWGGSDGLVPEQEINLDIQEDVISVTLGSANCFLVPAIPPNDAPTKLVLPMDGIAAGTYSLDVLHINGCWGDVTYQSEITVYPNARTPIFNHESPVDGQTVSGVGVVRGWACYPRGQGEIGKVTFTLNNSSFRIPLPYGSFREDTAEVCGYSSEDMANTGYGGVFYWGGFPDGEYTMTLFLDGEPFDSVSFFVAQPPPTDIPEDRGFRKGAEGEYVVENFLGTEETVTIRWSETDQNFIIVSYD